MAIDQLIARLRRAMMLDATAFEEARDDATFTPLALGAAAIAVLLAGFGAFLWAETVLDDTPSGWFVDTFILGSIFTILLFAAGMGVTYFLVTQVFHEEASPDALARVLAIGHVPYAAGLLVLIPQIGFAFGLLSVAAMFFYTNFGLKAAFPRIDPFKAAIAVAAGFAVWTLILPIVSDAPGDNFATGVFVYSLFE